MKIDRNVYFHYFKVFPQYESSLKNNVLMCEKKNERKSVKGKKTLGQSRHGATDWCSYYA